MNHGCCQRCVCSSSKIFLYDSSSISIRQKKNVSEIPILETVCSCVFGCASWRSCATRTWRRSACEKVCERMVARWVARARTGVALRTRARPSTRSTRRHAREVDSRFGGARGVAPPSRDGFPESSRTLFSPFAARRWVVPRRRAARPPSRGGRPRAGRPRPTRHAANAFVRVVETIGGVVARGNSPGRARSRPRSRGDRPRPPPRQRPAGRTGAPGKKNPERVGARDEPIAPTTSPLAPPEAPPDSARPAPAPSSRAAPPEPPSRPPN